jgi:hypothetical protein
MLCCALCSKYNSCNSLLQLFSHKQAGHLLDRFSVLVVTCHTYVHVFVAATHHLSTRCMLVLLLFHIIWIMHRPCAKAEQLLGVPAIFPGLWCEFWLRNHDMLCSPIISNGVPVCDAVMCYGAAGGRPFVWVKLTQWCCAETMQLLSLRSHC